MQLTMLSWGLRAGLNQKAPTHVAGTALRTTLAFEKLNDRPLAISQGQAKARAARRAVGAMALPLTSTDSANSFSHRSTIALIPIKESADRGLTCMLLHPDDPVSLQPPPIGRVQPPVNAPHRRHG